MHFTQTECWPVKPKSPQEGFFISNRTPHDSKHLNRWRGRKDRTAPHHCLSSQRGNERLHNLLHCMGDDSVNKDESLAYGECRVRMVLVSFPGIGVILGYHPRGNYVQK